MLLAFAPGTDLSALWKAYIHGHYRRHPKTGQQVWVDSYSDKRPEKHRTEFAHWQHRIEHVKDHLSQGHTREALHAFHDLGHDDSHKLARDLGLHDDGPDFADKKTLMGAIHGRLLAKKHDLQAQVGRQVKADFEKRKAAGTVGKQVTRVQFVQAPDGGTDFGAVPSLHSKLIADKSYPAAPIRMEEGGAFGGQHLAPSRMREFHDYGYASPAAVLDDVAKHFTQIFEQPNGRLLLVKRNGRAKFAAVELQPQAADQYYGVTTLFLEDIHPRGKPYEERGGRKLLWPVAQAAHSGSDTPFPAVTNPAGATVAGARESNLSVGQGAGQSKDKDAVTMSKEELIAEHEHLVDVLKSPDHGDDLKEAKKQEKELKGYKGEDGKSPGAKDTPESLAQQKSLASFEANYEMYGTMTVQPINPVSLPDGHSLVDVGFLRIKTPPSRADSDRFRLYPAADWYRYGVAKNDQGERYTFAEYPRTYLHQGNRVLLTFDRLSGDQLDDIRAFRGLLAANRKMYERHLAPTDDMFAAPPKRGPVVVFKKPAPAS